MNDRVEAPAEEDPEVAWLGACEMIQVSANGMLRLECAAMTTTAFNLHNLMAEPLQAQRADVDEGVRILTHWQAQSVDGVRKKAKLLRTLLGSQVPMPATSLLARSLADDVCSLDLTVGPAKRGLIEMAPTDEFAAIPAWGQPTLDQGECH